MDHSADNRDFSELADELVRRHIDISADGTKTAVLHYDERKLLSLISILSRTGYETNDAGRTAAYFIREAISGRDDEQMIQSSMRAGMRVLFKRWQEVKDWQNSTTTHYAFSNMMTLISHWPDKKEADHRLHLFEPLLNLYRRDQVKLTNNEQDDTSLRRQMLQPLCYSQPVGDGMKDIWINLAKENPDSLANLSRAMTGILLIPSNEKSIETGWDWDAICDVLACVANREKSIFKIQSSQHWIYLNNLIRQVVPASYPVISPLIASYGNQKFKAGWSILMQPNPINIKPASPFWIFRLFEIVLIYSILRRLRPNTRATMRHPNDDQIFPNSTPLGVIPVSAIPQKIVARNPG